MVPFSAAGTADLLARLVADRLGPVLGQPVVVEHRPGAGGIVGQEQVARASPDGYTLVVSSLGSFIISPVFTPVPFDPFRDFTPHRLSRRPAGRSVRQQGSALPYAFRPCDLCESPPRRGHLRDHLDRITNAVAQRAVQAQAGIKMTHVPYRGAGQIVTDVLGGHIATGITALAAVGGQVSSGAVRGLAIASEKRLPAYPDLPTYVEQGYAGLVGSTWFALSGPANMPREIVDRLNAEVVKILHASDLQARFRARGDRHQELGCRRLHGLFQGRSWRAGRRLRARSPTR